MLPEEAIRLLNSSPLVSFQVRSAPETITKPDKLDPLVISQVPCSGSFIKATQGEDLSSVQVGKAGKALHCGSRGIDAFRA